VLDPVPQLRPRDLGRRGVFHQVGDGNAAETDKILDEETQKTKQSGLDAKRVDLCARYLKDQIRADTESGTQLNTIKVQ
jgi:hypothetical protein